MGFIQHVECNMVSSLLDFMSLSALSALPFFDPGRYDKMNLVKKTRPSVLVWDSVSLPFEDIQDFCDLLVRFALQPMPPFLQC